MILEFTYYLIIIYNLKFKLIYFTFIIILQIPKLEILKKWIKSHKNLKNHKKT